MAYSELVKSFERIRNYMREFYVYGFKSRDEYGMKSARSYDNERRRIESWLGDYMSFHQESSGKKVFLSMDSRRVPCNPLYKAFKAKSFTDKDITLHFYIMDLLADGSALSSKEIVDRINDDYLSHFNGDCRLAVRSMAVTGQRLPYGAARKADNAFNHFAKAMAEGPSLRSEDRFIRSRHERPRRRGTVIYSGYLCPV